MINDKRKVRSNNNNFQMFVKITNQTFENYYLLIDYLYVFVF